ncbi:MAG: ECF transporter S component [Candidatus Helarchaeota archaeon]|nr:ECF transporter S component [Candidatus Helarchaeota archaeon]
MAEKETRSRWRIGKESIFPLLLGLGIYIGLEVLFVILNLPVQTYFYITFALVPAIAVPISFGAKYGPIVGFLVGFGGKFLADLILYGGIWIWWPLGFGLMGLIPGLSKYYRGKYTEGWNLFKISLYALAAAFLGTFVASMLSVFADQLGLFFPILFYSIPLFFIAGLNGVIIAPIMARGLEYIDSKITPTESKETPARGTPHLNQAGVLLAGFCFLLSSGLYIIKYIFNTEGHFMGCGAGAPFGHEIAGDIGIALELGIFIFLGIGIMLSVGLVIRLLFTKK